MKRELYQFYPDLVSQWMDRKKVRGSKDRNSRR